MRLQKLSNDQMKLIERFYDEGFSCKRISNAIHISVGAVFNHLEKNGMVRQKSEARKYSYVSLTPEHIERIRELGKRERSDETRKKLSESKKTHRPGHAKKRDDGYITVYYPDHPDATNDGYVMQHRLIMEQHIGRRLEKNEVVHHKNRNRADNRLENLQLMTASEHMSMHMIERHKRKRGEALCSIE